MLTAEIIRVLREDHAEADKTKLIDCIIDTAPCFQYALYHKTLLIDYMHQLYFLSMVTM